MNPNHPHQDPALAELQSIRHELTELRDELGKLRSDLTRKRPISIANQVAQDVIIAVVVWLLVSLIFLVLSRLLFARLLLSP